MEQINKVDICGIVGNARIQNIGDTKMISFSVATEHSYKDSSGNTLYETTWLPVVAFQKSGMPDFEQIQKMKGVHVLGRLRNNRYASSDGHDRTVIEVLADKIELM